MAVSQIMRRFAHEKKSMQIRLIMSHGCVEATHGLLLTVTED